MACDDLVEMVMHIFKESKANEYEKLKDKDVGFRMIGNSEETVTKDLDQLRAKPPLFITLNDDMDTDDLQLKQRIRSIIRDFYLWFFPFPSQFELQSSKATETLFDSPSSSSPLKSELKNASNTFRFYSRSLGR